MKLSEGKKINLSSSIKSKPDRSINSKRTILKDSTFNVLKFPSNKGETLKNKASIAF